MKIAVIGGGPAAASACIGLLSEGSHDVHVLDIGRETKGPSWMLDHPILWGRRDMAQLHRSVLGHSDGWIPEKSFRGAFPIKYDGTDVIYKSDVLGGLSKFWGASFLPFTDADMGDWPITYGELSPYYYEVLRHLKVAGEADRLSEYFLEPLFNQPPISTPAIFQRLGHAVNASDGPTSREGAGFVAGSPRLAVATSGDQSCTYCGHCFYGCYRDSIYSADQTINELSARHLIRYRSGQKVDSFRRSVGGRTQLTITGTDGVCEVESFDRVYIGAGCIESTRIVARSLGIVKETFGIRENPMFYVPIVYIGSPEKTRMNSVVALNNLLLGRLPGGAFTRYVHMQVYPLNPYLWRHAFARAFGVGGIPLARLASAMIGGQVLMMLFYFHGDYSEGSSLGFSPDGDQFRFQRGDTDKLAKELVSDLDAHLRNTGFRVIASAMAPLAAGGSYHYAGTIPMGGSKLGVGPDCQIDQGVFLVDSATFPSLPAQNHTFTIMANSLRVARESLQ